MAELTYPNRVNTQGFPALSGTPTLVTEGGVEKLVLEFQPHLALNDNWSGAFFVSVNGTIVAGTTSNQPVVFRTAGVSGETNLYRYSGGQATLGDIITSVQGSVLLCFYNADTKRLQLIGLR